MADDEVIQRWDRRLDWIDGKLKKIEGHIRSGEAGIERNNEYIEGNREFMRVLTLRHERVTDRMIHRLDELTDEIRAQRAALFRILDRLDDGGATSGA